MPDRDVTKLVEIGNVDDDELPINKCVCGAEFMSWQFNISIDRACECPKCGRKLYFTMRVRVFEVVDTPRSRNRFLTDSPLPLPWRKHP